MREQEPGIYRIGNNWGSRKLAATLKKGAGSGFIEYPCVILATKTSTESRYYVHCGRPKPGLLLMIFIALKNWATKGDHNDNIRLKPQAPEPLRI